MSFLRVTVEIDRLLMPCGFWDVERQYGTFGQIVLFWIYGQKHADLVSIS